MGTRRWVWSNRKGSGYSSTLGFLLPHSNLGRSILVGLETLHKNIHTQDQYCHYKDHETRITLDWNSNTNESKRNTCLKQIKTPSNLLLKIWKWILLFEWLNDAYPCSSVTEKIRENDGCQWKLSSDVTSLVRWFSLTWFCNQLAPPICPEKSPIFSPRIFLKYPYLPLSHGNTRPSTTFNNSVPLCYQLAEPSNVIYHSYVK